MKHVPYILLTVILCCLVQMSVAQSQVKVKLQEAQSLLNTYIETSRFNEGIDEKSLSSFQKLFSADAMVIFDLPFRNEERQNPEIKRISKDDRIQDEAISVYGKSMPITLYIRLLDKINANKDYDKFSPGINISYTGRRDTTKIKRDTVIFEISKSFQESNWGIPDLKNYLVGILFKEGKPFIFEIRINEEKTNEMDLLFTFLDQSAGRKGQALPVKALRARFRAEFDETINNKYLEGETDSIGRLLLPAAVSRRTVIYLDTVENPNRIRYEIPFDWNREGKNVLDQPPGGFVIGLRPYRWNGITYSLAAKGALTWPGETDLTHFEAGSDFKTSPGYRIGISFQLTYFFNHNAVLSDQKRWLLGLGSGAGLNYMQSSVKSDGFTQKRYSHVDINDSAAQIQFWGRNFSEIWDLTTISIPLFFEVRKRTGEKFSLSVKAGIDLAFAVSATFEAEGHFDRWGYYDFNNNQLPVKEDSKLNYFTDSVFSYSGDIDFNTPLAEGFLEINGLLHLFKKNPDNTLELGIQVAFPITKSTDYPYPASETENLNGFWISRGNNEYRSPVYGTERFYNLYFGVKVGINFLKYRPR